MGRADGTTYGERPNRTFQVHWHTLNPITDDRTQKMEVAQSQCNAAVAIRESVIPGQGSVRGEGYFGLAERTARNGPVIAPNGNFNPMRASGQDQETQGYEQVS